MRPSGKIIYWKASEVNLWRCGEPHPRVWVVLDLDALYLWLLISDQVSPIRYPSDYGQNAVGDPELSLPVDGLALHWCISPANTSICLPLNLSVSLLQGRGCVEKIKNVNLECENILSIWSILVLPCMV